MLRARSSPRLFTKHYSKLTVLTFMRVKRKLAVIYNLQRNKNESVTVKRMFCLLIPFYSSRLLPGSGNILCAGNESSGSS